MAAFNHKKIINVYDDPKEDSIEKKVRREWPYSKANLKKANQAFDEAGKKYRHRVATFED